VNITSFGEEIGLAITVIPEIGDMEDPLTTLTRNVAPVAAVAELLVALSAPPTLDRLCMAVTAMADVPMTTIKRNRATVLAIALRERPRAPAAMAEVIIRARIDEWY